MSQIGLNIDVWNADRLANKALELELFVKCHNIDIMLVSETHFCGRSYCKLHGLYIVSKQPIRLIGNAVALPFK